VIGSKRRLAILESAAPIFNQRGYAGTSIADILAATSLEKGGLYNHFASKEQLAVETFDYAYAQVEAYFVAALEGTESGLPRLRAYIDAFERYCTNPVVEGGCPVINACIEADDALPFLRERVSRAFKAIRGMALRNVSRAIEKGQIARDVDCERAADFIVAALEGAVVLARGMRSRTHARNVASTLGDWLEGLAR
jgi:AcrR family transcriptional regulator